MKAELETLKKPLGDSELQNTSARPRNLLPQLCITSFYFVASIR